jgi:hypothetical protein
MSVLLMVCGTCGSTKVLADAFAEWNVSNQQWELQNTFDKGAYCEGKCDGETRIEEIDLTQHYPRSVYEDAVARHGVTLDYASWATEQYDEDHPDEGIEP